MALAMCYTTYDKKQFIEALTQALSRGEDTQITVGENGAFHHIKGIASIERDVRNILKWLRRSREYKQMTTKQQNKEEQYRTRELRKRLDNPQSIVNRFKRTPASMWVA